MLRGQCYDLHPMAGKEVAGTDKQDLGPLFHKTHKSRVDVVSVTGIEDRDFPPNWDGRSLHICDHRLDDGRVFIRVDEHRNPSGRGARSSSSPSCFDPIPTVVEMTPV